MKGFVFLVWCLLAPVKAIFEEQLGEYDWKNEKMGFITHSVKHNEKTYVATAEDVLACVSSNGKFLWRVVFPKHSNFHKLLVVDKNIVTVSSQHVISEGNNSTNIALVRGWSLTGGKLEWDYSLGEWNSQQKVDIVHNTDNNLLTVLSSNVIHFLTLKSQDLKAWTWSPEIQDSQKSSSPLILTSLIVPTTFPKSDRNVANKAAKIRIATGCFRPSSDLVDSQCGDTAVLTVDVERREVDGELFLPLPVSLSTLSATVSSDAAVKYLPDDVLFGADVNDAGLLQMKVLFLRTNTVQILSGSGSRAVSVRASPSTFVLATSNGEITPAASWCISTGETSTACEVFSLKRTGDVWALSTETSCVALSEHDKALVVLDTFPHLPNVARAAHCVVASWDHEDSVLRSLTIASGTASSVSVPLGLRHPLPCDSQSFQHLSVARSGQAGQVLLVLTSGLTVQLQISSGSQQLQDRVQWSSDEGLTRLQQVLLVDVEKHLAVTVESDADGEARVPSVAERLRLQRDDLLELVSALDLKKSIKSTVRRLRNLAFVGYAKKFLASKGLGGSSFLSTDFGSEEEEGRDLAKLRLFGFDKVAIGVSYSDALDRQLSFSADNSADAVSVRTAGFRLVALSMLRDGDGHTSALSESLWIAFPKVDSLGSSAVTSVELLANHASPSKGAPVRSVTLVVGTADGHISMWCFEASTGKSCGDRRHPAAPASFPVSSSWPESLSGAEFSKGFSGKVSLVAPAAEITRRLLRSVSRQPAGAPHSHSVLKTGHAIVHSAIGASAEESICVTILSGTPPQNSSEPEFVHFIDKEAGSLNIYKLGPLACVDYQVKGVLTADFHSRSADLVSTVVFPRETERIVGVAYRNSLDTVNSRSAILGDDSVLLKYLNPNVVLISTLSAAAVAHDYSASSTEAEEQPAVLTLTLVDTATGRVIKRIAHDNAALPVLSLLVENSIVATYWNEKAKRTELSSVALYEGVIEKYGLGPLASRATGSSPPPYRAATYSAYSSIIPIAMQKTYTLPRAVTALQHTLTASGVSNKNVLVGLRTGQLYSLDMRMIHPRRPMGDPSQSEKEEGLVKYNPFLVLSPFTALTYNYTLAGHGPSRIVSAASKLESTSLVLSFGNGVDMHLNRALPSQGFDMLASDFNYVLLIAILSALALAVLTLRHFHMKKHIGAIWA